MPPTAMKKSKVLKEHKKAQKEKVFAKRAAAAAKQSKSKNVQQLVLKIKPITSENAADATVATDQATPQPNIPVIATDEVRTVLVGIIFPVKGRPGGRNGLFLTLREVDQTHTRFLKDIFASHGLVKLEPCLCACSGEIVGFYLATFPDSTAAEGARTEWNYAEIDDNLLMSAITMEYIEEDKINPKLLQQPSSPAGAKAREKAGTWVPCPPSNNFEVWWGEQDLKHWIFHQRNVKHLTNRHDNGVWLYDGLPDDPDPRSFSRETPARIVYNIKNRERDEPSEPVELVDWHAKHMTGRITLLPYTSCFTPLDSPLSDESSPQSFEDEECPKKGTPDSSPPPDSPCLPYTNASYAVEEFAQTKDTARLALSTGRESEADNSGSRDRAISSSHGSAMHETLQDDREHTDEIFSQQNDATYPVFLIGRDDQARKPKSHERTTSSNDGTVVDEVASDDREHKPPLSFSNALPRRPESIMNHKMECNLAQRPTWTNDGPQAYLPAISISPKASQYSSSPPSLQMCEAVTYQYPHFVRYSPEDENVDTDRAISDLHSSANDYTVICPREFVDRVHVSQAHSTGGRSDGATSSRSVTLHQPEAIRTWTPVMIKEVPFTFAEVEHMCTAAPEPEPEDDDLVDPADAWYADLATKTANEEIEVEYVSASPEHREHNRLLIADPRLEWLATILTQREIEGDVPHDTPDHCLRNDRVVQVVTVDTSEQSISIGFLVED
jgi:hypothetical protein